MSALRHFFKIKEKEKEDLRNCLIQYEVDKVEKQFGLAKPEKVVIGLHKQRPSNNLRTF